MVALFWNALRDIKELTLSDAKKIVVDKFAAGDN